jgi:hypothetical protein
MGVGVFTVLETVVEGNVKSSKDLIKCTLRLIGIIKVLDVESASYSYIYGKTVRVCLLLK